MKLPQLSEAFYIYAGIGTGALVMFALGIMLGCWIGVWIQGASDKLTERDMEESE